MGFWLFKVQGNLPFSFVLLDDQGGWKSFFIFLNKSFKRAGFFVFQQIGGHPEGEVLAGDFFPDDE